MKVFEARKKSVEYYGYIVFPPQILDMGWGNLYLLYIYIYIYLVILSNKKKST